MDSEMFATTPPTRLFFRCALPEVVTAVFGALYSVVDGLFVGRFLGEDALAAVNLIMPVIMIIEAISNMIATGASVQMSVLLGKGNREKASRVFSFSIKFILAFSVVLSVLGFVFAKPFITVIAPGATENAISFGTDYLKVYALFGPLIPVYFAIDNYLRVCGKQRLSMIIGIASQGLNVLLDFILIAVLHQGIKAAALASCLSIALGSVVMLALFTGKRMDVYYTRKNISSVRFFRILANGSSELFSNIAASVMSIVMNLFLLKYGGTTAVAAFAILMYVDSIIGMVCFGMCDALQPAISFCYGAGLIDRMKRIFRRVLAASVITSFVAFLFMLLAGRHVAMIFIKPGDTTLAEMSVTAIKLFSFSYLVGWIDMCFSSYFTALERPGRSLLVSFFGTLFFPISCLFILTSLFGLNGVWLMPTVSAIASGILTLILATNMRVSRNTPDRDR